MGGGREGEEAETTGDKEGYGRAEGEKDGKVKGKEEEKVEGQGVRFGSTSSTKEKNTTFVPEKHRRELIIQNLMKGRGWLPCPGNDQLPTASL